MIDSRRNFLLKGTAAAVAAASMPSNLRALPTHTRSVKKGLGGAAPANSGLVTNWYYDWGLRPATKGMPLVDAHMQFYPMCWGWRVVKRAADDDGVPEGLDRLRAEKPAVFFGFNEPDHSDQSNLSVEQAVKAWPSLQGIARDLVGPSCANPNGEWMEKFMNEVERQKLQVNSLGYHSYPSDSVDGFIQQLESFHAKYKMPVWVTEFAVADWAAKGGAAINRYSVDRVAAFMKGACAYMDRTPWLRGYAWFPVEGKTAVAGRGPLSSSVLYNPDGTLNDLGKLYDAL